MQQYLKCAFGMHEYEVKEELVLFTTYIDNNMHLETQNVGKTIVSRCKHCGKIIYKDIITKIKG